MPNWKKVIISGSNVSQLNNDGVYLRTTGDGVISSSAQLTGTFDTRYLNTTGDNVLSSSAQIASDISGAFTGAGFVDTTGTPSNTQIAFFSDSNTIQGSSNLTISGSGTPSRILTLDGVFHSTGSVGLNGFVAISGSSSNSSSRIGISAYADEGLLYSSNTAEVKSAIRLSTFYTDGYSIGRFITPGATNTLRIGPDVILLGKLSVTGSLSISGSTLISSSNQISLVASASHASSGNNFTATGQTEIFGTLSHRDPLGIGMETLTFVSGAFVHDGSVQNPGPGQLPAIEILNIDTYTSGVRAVFISYFVQGHGTLAHEYNKRVGNIRFTFTTSGSITNEVVFDETSTLDIGNTSGFTFTVSHNGFNAILLANNTNGMDMFLNYEAKAFSII